MLKFGGLKEKLLAASRGGIRHVLIPKDNARDLKEVPEEVLDALEITPVAWMDEALEIALERSPVQSEAEGVPVVSKETSSTEGTPASPH